MEKDQQVEKMKLLEKRQSTTGQTKNKKEWEFPTLENDHFMIPMVIAGGIYVYEHIKIYYANEPFEESGMVVIFPLLIFLFSLVIYLGIWDAARSLLSRSGIRRALSLLRRQLALGVLDLHAWRRTRSEDRIRRSTEKRTPEPGSGSSQASDHRVLSYPRPESIERIVDAPADRHSDHEHQKKHS
jgi:hypothetical protein